MLDYTTILNALGPYGLRDISIDRDEGVLSDRYGNAVHYGAPPERVRLDFQTTPDRLSKLAAIAIVAERFDEAEWPSVLEALAAESLLTGGS